MQYAYAIAKLHNLRNHIDTRSQLLSVISLKCWAYTLWENLLQAYAQSTGYWDDEAQQKNDESSLQNQSPAGMMSSKLGIHFCNL